MNRTAAVRVVLLELATLTSAVEGIGSLTPVFIEGFESGSNCVWSQALPWTAQTADLPTTILGTTVGGSNGIDAACQAGGSPEVVYLLSPAEDGTLTIVLEPENPTDDDLGFYIRTSCAAIDEILCVDLTFGNEFGQVAVTTGQPIFLFVDGFQATDAGPFALTLSLADAVCGDNTINPPEVCDGTNLDGETCESLGFSGGTLSCATDCSFDISDCFNQTCGNNVIEGTELCDGSDLQGFDCTHFGLINGELQCAPTCDDWDFSLCLFL